MAWLLPEDEVVPLEARSGASNAPSLAMINYWVMRCLPLWVPGASEKSTGHRSILIACNRTGREGGASITSAFLTLRNALRRQLMRARIHTQRSCEAASCCGR